MTDAVTAPAPKENVPVGTLLALLTIPIAVVAFSILTAATGSVYFYAGIVIGLIAYGLYRLGAKAISIVGAIIVAGISLVAAVLAYLGAVAWVNANEAVEVGLVSSPFEFLGHPLFGEAFSFAFSANTSNFWLFLLASVAGAVIPLVNVFKERKAATQAAAVPPVAPEAPQVPEAPKA